MALKLDWDLDWAGFGRYLPRPDPGRWAAGVLALLVHALLAAFLFFGVRWTTRAPEAVEVTLYRPAPATPAQPVAVVHPTPEPRPEPVIQPEAKPVPKPMVKAVPKPVAVTKPEPTPPKPAIAIKEKVPAKTEHQPEHKPEPKPAHKPEALVKTPPKPEPKPAAKAPPKPESKPESKAAAKPETKTPPPVPTKAEPRPDQEWEKQMRADENMVRQTKNAVAADAELKRVGDLQASNARKKALKAWTDKIANKIRRNILVPPNVTGNPEVVFLVSLLPDGGLVGEPKLRASTGNPALDDAIERAIKKSDPLPKPDDPSLMVRELELKFRPLAE